MTLDDYIAERNRIQLEAEAIGEEAGIERWVRLGVANRHIQRIIYGKLSLTPAVEEEIVECLRRNSGHDKG
jgi:hypothetical protein